MANGGSSSSLLCFGVSSSSVFHSFCQHILPSLQWSQAVPLVTAKKKNGAAASGSRRRRERSEREVIVLLTVICFFHPLYSVLFPFLLSPAPIFHSLFPWFCWRLLPMLVVVVERKKQRWCPGGKDDSSSSLCRDCSLCFSLPTSVFAFSFFFVSPACFPLFSKKNPFSSSSFPLYL